MTRNKFGVNDNHILCGLLLLWKSDVEKSSYDFFADVFIVDDSAHTSERVKKEIIF